MASRVVGIGRDAPRLEEARRLEVDPVGHDDRLALTSHLPHVVAAALAASVPPDWLPLAAGAYRDGTRVAGSDADLWAGIFRENRRPILEALDEFQGQLDAFRAALEADDPARLVDWWQAAKERRLRFESG